MKFRLPLWLAEGKTGVGFSAVLGTAAQRDAIRPCRK